MICAGFIQAVKSQVRTPQLVLRRPVERDAPPSHRTRTGDLYDADASTRDLLNILDAIAKAGAGFKSLGDTWADTTTAHGRLMLTVLGGLASSSVNSSGLGQATAAPEQRPVA